MFAVAASSCLLHVKKQLQTEVLNNYSNTYLHDSMMALRKFMHPRNKYKQGADFKRLAVLYPDFCNQTTTDLSGKLLYNFKNEESLRVLAKTLLKHDFDLEVEIPTEKLIPAMPLRLNYVLWIEDLVTYAKLKEFGEIHGIDIGAGAVCVYPLLCAKIYGWRMTATEISETSILSANNNVARNSLDRLIKVIHVKNENTILLEVLKESDLYSFTMCNPPFFNTDASVKRDKRLPPRNVATGNESELRVEGGEKSFITRLISESLMLGERVKIYTTMLGQKSSCLFFRSELKKRNIHNATWTEFCQGHTKRWGLAWTFVSKEIFDLTNAPVIRTRDSQAIKQQKDRPSEVVFPLGDKFHNVDELVVTLKMWIRELKIEIEELDIPKEFNGWTCRLRAHEDSWSHARRKRRMAQSREQSPKKSRLENCEPERSGGDCAEPKEKRDMASHSTTSPKNALLVCSLMVGELENKDAGEKSEVGNLVKVCVLYEDGHGGKNALETFRQHLINKLSIREYLLSKSRSRSFRKNRSKGRKIKSGVTK